MLKYSWKMKTLDWDIFFDFDLILFSKPTSFSYFLLLGICPNIQAILISAPIFTVKRHLSPVLINWTFLPVFGTCTNLIICLFSFFLCLFRVLFFPFFFCWSKSLTANLPFSSISFCFFVKYQCFVLALVDYGCKI